ncbi:unnamed protein product [Amoebophrya sp. A120]|nr:unnamed protein product [Amoebophrya sp. A120]|eukprot:GSA120T00013605001.1
MSTSRLWLPRSAIAREKPGAPMPDAPGSSSSHPAEKPVARRSDEKRSAGGHAALADPDERRIRPGGFQGFAMAVPEDHHNEDQHDSSDVRSQHTRVKVELAEGTKVRMVGDQHGHFPQTGDCRGGSRRRERDWLTLVQLDQPQRYENATGGGWMSTSRLWLRESAFSSMPEIPSTPDGEDSPGGAEVREALLRAELTRLRSEQVKFYESSGEGWMRGLPAPDPKR